MDTVRYLKRIGYAGPVEPTIKVLNRLHLAHMYAVPFENLDIHLGIPIHLELRRLYRKIIENERGGFCYELNGLFYWLLIEFGFEVDMYSARVYGSDGEPGPEFDHMLLRVNEDWIADVGFGESFTEPLRFNSVNQEQDTGVYRLAELGDRILLERDAGDGWKPQYDFSMTRRKLKDYQPMCDHQQTSPDSIFTQKKVCSLAMEDGRVTYANGRLIETKEGSKIEKPVEGETELSRVLKKKFGVVIEGDLARLL